MSQTRIHGQDIKNATITDADVATANKDGAKNVASMRTLGATVTTQAYSDAPDSGSAVTASSSDHKHGMPAPFVVGAIGEYWFNDLASDLTVPSVTATVFEFVHQVGVNPDTIIRSSGNFVTEGFLAGQKIKVAGAADAGNNGTFVVTAVATTTLTLAKTHSLTSRDDASSITINTPRENLRRVPPIGTEQDESVSVVLADGAVAIDTYTTTAGSPGSLFIPIGTWLFTAWAYVDSTAHASTMKFEVNKVTELGVSNVLFTTAETTITATTLGTAQKIEQEHAIASPIALLATDRLSIRVLVHTASSHAKVIHFIHDGTSRASHVTTTLNALSTFGTPNLTLGTTNVLGTSSVGIATNSTIAAFDSTAPVTQDYGDAAAVGAATVAARRDHKHGMPATPAVVLRPRYKSAVLLLEPTAYWRLGEADYYYNAVRRSVPTVYYRFNEATPGTGTLTDDMGYYNGTYVHSPTGGVTGAIANDTNKAVTFDGANDRASLASGTQLSCANYVSVEFWFKRNGKPADDEVIFDRREQYSTKGYSVGPGTYGTMALFCGDGTDYGAVGSNADICDNAWHHIVAVRDDHTLEIYVDGLATVNLGAVWTSVDSMAGTTASAIAAHYVYDPGTTQYFEGSLDELAIYKDRALTAAEVAAHYAARLGPAPSTVADNAEGTAAYDGTYVGYPTLGATGALTGDADTAVTLSSAAFGGMTLTGGVGACANWSIGMWIKGEATGGGGYDRLFDTFGDIIDIGRDATTGAINLYDGSGWISMGTSVAAGTWAFLVFTFNGTNLCCYRDGVSTYGPTAKGRALTAANIRLGAANGGGGSEGLGGSMDEAAIWNRALSATEIVALYAIGTGT